MLTLRENIQNQKCAKGMLPSAHLKSAPYRLALNTATKAKRQEHDMIHQTLNKPYPDLLKVP